jgi:hypothetical protein
MMCSFKLNDSQGWTGYRRYALTITASGRYAASQKTYCRTAARIDAGDGCRAVFRYRPVPYPSVPRFTAPATARRRRDTSASIPAPA